ncbi:MAG TPA: acyl-CoA carboxylase subunit epsilon [Micromonospora sp.]|nr:acyl-CoA carboxylase subunit epsilon [Micromonospora sp.]
MSADDTGLVRVVRGRPTDEELAAVIVALLSWSPKRVSPTTEPTARRLAGWTPVSDYSSPGSWARSGH